MQKITCMKVIISSPLIIYLGFIGIRMIKYGWNKFMDGGDDSVYQD